MLEVERIGVPRPKKMGVPPDEYALPIRSRVGGRAAAGSASLRSFGPPSGLAPLGALRIPHAPVTAGPHLFSTLGSGSR